MGSERTYATGWVTLFAPSQDKMELAQKAWNELLDAVIDTGGCPYWTGLLWENRVLPKTNPEFLETYWKVKKALDPDNILAPGTFRGYE